MKTQRLRVVAAAVAALLLLAAVAAVQAGDPDLRGIDVHVEPRRPTELDTLEIVVDVTLPHPCYDVQFLSLEGTYIALRGDEVADCPLEPHTIQVRRPLATLAAGHYGLDAGIEGDYYCDSAFCGGYSMGVSTDFGVYAVGDADCRGSIDSADATIVLQYAAGLIEVLYCYRPSDANRDGDVQSNDATLILQYTAGLLAQLPPSSGTHITGWYTRGGGKL